MEFSRHLLIDGYNVIHDWPELHAELRGDGSVARSLLADAVRPLHDRERIRVTLVFDGRGADIEIERPGGDNTFSFLFSPATMSADDVIERLIGAADDPSLYTVVTRDRAERETIEALGATGMSPRDLKQWIERTQALLARDLKSHSREIDRRWKS